MTQQSTNQVPIKLGISTSVLKDKQDLALLLLFEPDVVEFYNYPSDSLPLIKNFCRCNNISIALHTPVPYDSKGPLRYFAPTGPDQGMVKEALKMALNTIRCAVRMEAIHIVVHFPSPYTKIVENISDEAVATFLDPLAEEARKQGVSVLIENVSAHPTFYRPEQYLKLLEQYSNLRFCLDLGHAHLLTPTCTISNFINTLNNRIKSVHVYNTKITRYGQFGHEYVMPEQSSEDGWINLLETVKLLSNIAEIKLFILELRALNVEEIPQAVRGAKWFRGLLSG